MTVAMGFPASLLTQSPDIFFLKEKGQYMKCLAQVKAASPGWYRQTDQGQKAVIKNCSVIKQNFKVLQEGAVGNDPFL